MDEPLDGAPGADFAPREEVRAAEGRPGTHHLTHHRYVALVHPEDTLGVVVLTHSVRLPEFDADGKEQWRTRSTGATGAEITDAVLSLHPRSVTMNVFRKREGENHSTNPKKATFNLAGLNACWVDLDFYKEEAYRHATPRTMVPEILHRCYDRGLPYPSYILATGRGVLVVWLHDRQRPSMLRVWRAMQNCAYEAFGDMGSDARARVCTMSFSIAGRKKEDRAVEIIWPAHADEIQRLPFEVLRQQFLPYSPEEVAAYRKAQARERAAKAREKEARKAAALAAGEAVERPKLTAVTLHRTVYNDLRKLFERRFGGRPVPLGQRDTWLYHLSVSAAWCMSPDDLVAEIERLSPLCGLPPRKGRAMMGTVIRRARRAARAETDAFKGGRSDPRYKAKPRGLVRELDVTVAEIRELGLRILLTDAVRREREADRSQQRRVEAGAKPRGDAQAARLALGQRALKLRAKGMTTEAVATQEGVSVSQVRKAVREAVAVNAIGGAVPKPKRGRPTKSVELASSLESAPDGKCHDSTGSIDAYGPAVEAAGAVVAIEGRTYTAPVRCSAPQTATDARCVPTGPAGVVVPGPGEVPAFLRHLLDARAASADMPSA